MSQALNYILEPSACLSKTQLTDYVQGRLIPEEVYAVETHLNGCPLCNMAIDGMLLQPDAALEAVATLNPAFIKQHFEAIEPRIHLNSVAPAVPARHKRQKAGTMVLPIRSIAALTAAGLVAFGVFWLLNKINVASPAGSMQKSEVAAPEQQQITVATGTPPTAAQPHTNATAPATTVPKEPAKPAVPAAAHAQPDTGQATPAAATVPVTLPKQLAPPEVKDTPPAIADTTVVSPASEAAPTPPKKEATTPKAQSTSPPAAQAPQTETDGYRLAISTYKKDLNSPDIATRNRARLASAQAYEGLGKRDKALQLLDQIMEEGGPHKAEARRLRRQLRNEK